MMGKNQGHALRIDLGNRLVRRGQQMIILSLQDCELLELLVRHEGQAIPSEKIARTLWPSEDRISRQDNLKHYVYRLRNKIEVDPHNPQYLQTVQRRGYRFQTDGSGPADGEESPE